MLSPLKEEREEGKGGIKISSGSGAGDFEGLLRIEVDQEDSNLCRWERDVLHTPHVYPDPDHKPFIGPHKR